MSTDWVELLGPIVIVGAGAVGTVTSALWAQRRRARHGRLYGAEDALTRAGFTIVRVKEELQPARDAWDTPDHTTVSLRGSLDERTTMTLAWAGEHAAGALRITGLAVVRRVTFTIAREDAASRLARKIGVSDIEVGDAKLDDALKLKGWPVDTVRGVLATPAVRGALSTLFAHASVEHVRLAPAADGFGKGAAQGALTLAWRLPWEQVATLRALAADLRALAVAVDDARWAAPRGAPDDDVVDVDAAGPASGSPFGVPGTRGR